MSIYYPSSCEDSIPEYVCVECGSIESAKVRSIAFIHNSVAFTDKEDPSEWQTYIAAGTIIIIPFTAGSFDGGAPKETNGFGDQEFRTNGSSYSVNYKDPNYKSNRNFYNTIKETLAYSIAFRSETQTHFSVVPVNVEVKNPIADDINADVVWDITVKWASRNLVEIYDTPANIFNRCIALD